MDKSRRNFSSSPPPPASNDGEPAELESLTSSELISFLESSFRRSEFVRVAGILKSREEESKAEALKDLSSKLAHLESKNGSLEKELRAVRRNEAVRKMEKEIVKQKGRFLFLRRSFEKMEKTAQEKIRVLMEDNEKERANCLKLEEQLKLKKKASDESIAEIDSWKSKYSKLEAWILRFLDNNSILIKKVREDNMNREKQNIDIIKICKAAEESLRSNVDFDKQPKAVIDIESDGDEDSRKRNIQIPRTSGINGVLEVDDEDDEDDVVCIRDLMVRRFAKGIK